ncbi:MAG: acyl-CoA thioesterase [Pseudomonadota bacterium]
MIETSIYSADYEVSFGDCDPAGIVFYPNIFAWLDRTFHRFLRTYADGHAALCKALDLKGIGVTSAHCGFRAPVKEADQLIVSIDAIQWNERGFEILYRGRVDGHVVFEGTESRALFKLVDKRMRSGDPATLRARLNIDAQQSRQSHISKDKNAAI